MAINEVRINKAQSNTNYNHTVECIPTIHTWSLENHQVRYAYVQNQTKAMKWVRNCSHAAKHAIKQCRLDTPCCKKWVRTISKLVTTHPMTLHHPTHTNLGLATCYIPHSLHKPDMKSLYLSCIKNMATSCYTMLNILHHGHNTIIINNSFTYDMPEISRN